jgi:serine protease
MRTVSALVVVLGTLAIGLPHAHAQSTDGVLKRGIPESLIPGRALIKLNGLDPSTATLTSKEGRTLEEALKEIRMDTGVNLWLVRPSVLGWGLFEIRDLKDDAMPTEAQTLELIKALDGHAAVAAAQEDRWYRTFTLPNDAGYDDMWHLKNMGMEQAWDITTGSDAQRIGVVDTGVIRGHEDLSAKDQAGYDFIADDWTANDGNGRDAEYNDSGDGADCGYGNQGDSFHGTHVSGTILASTNNGAGVAGINWNAKLVTARSMGRCGGALSDIMEGAAWMAGYSVQNVPAIGADRVSVMNLSLGGESGCSNYEQDVIDWVNGEGVVFVAAAGNNGGSVGSPANCTGVVTVAAHGSDASRSLTPYSSFGSSVEVVAPGGYITGDNNDGILSAIGPGTDSYSWQQGTSMAAPHVTGAISLMQALDPSLDRAGIAALFAENPGPCSGCQGVPSLQLDAVLAAMGGTPSDPPVDPTPPPTSGDDAYEENDSFDAAVAISCGDVLNLEIVANDQDWFSFTADDGSAITASVQAASGADIDLYLLNGPANEDIIEYSESPTGTEEVQSVSTGSELHLVVNPYNGATDSYVLTLQCEGEPAANPNDPADPSDPADPNEPGQGTDDPTGGEQGGQGEFDPAPGGSGSDAPTRDVQAQGGCSQSGQSAPTLLVLGLLALFAIRRRR